MRKQRDTTAIVESEYQVESGLIWVEVSVEEWWQEAEEGKETVILNWRILSSKYMEQIERCQRGGRSGGGAGD